MAKRTAQQVAQRADLKLDLALQGGGAHGAFTWGVLDRLLEEDWLKPTGISGASAGAMNAVVMASGLVSGGPAEAQERLQSYWKAVHRAARMSNPALGAAEAFPQLFAASAAWWSLVVGDRVSLNLDPNNGLHAQELMRELLEDHVDFEALRRPEAPRLFISAADVARGRLRLFRNEDLSVEACLASACLPQAFPPVSIDGVDYWDGGYVANPPILPLIAESPCDDLLLVTVNPISRPETPRGTEEINERISELGFNLSLMKDVRTINVVKEALGDTPPKDAAPLVRAAYRLRLHEIHDEDSFGKIDPKSKMLPEWSLLTQLLQMGREATESWLDRHREDLGIRSTAMLEDRYI